MNPSEILPYSTPEGIRSYVPIEDFERVAELAEKSCFMTEFLRDQEEFSTKTFGPQYNPKRVLNHLKKEVVEVEENIGSLEEWTDIAILALEGARRSGATNEQIMQAMRAKLEKNKKRVWPDWRESSGDDPICHVKGIND